MKLQKVSGLWIATGNGVHVTHESRKGAFVAWVAAFKIARV